MQASFLGVFRSGRSLGIQSHSAHRCLVSELSGVVPVLSEGASLLALSGRSAVGMWPIGLCKDLYREKVLDCGRCRHVLNMPRGKGQCFFSVWKPVKVQAEQGSGPYSPNFV